MHVLLAAGAGERFSGPVHKLLAPIRGVPVLTLSVRAMVEAAGQDCAVVLGADISAELLEALEGCTTVVNPQWRTGQRSSVLCAVGHARAHGAAQVVIGPLAQRPEHRGVDTEEEAVTLGHATGLRSRSGPGRPGSNASPWAFRNRWCRR
ncbi:MAG: hypothetical protein EBS48_10495 [Actinobacteria bacterium]|nr:hypothetical protein [Actinomycetota bacterium]